MTLKDMIKLSKLPVFVCMTKRLQSGHQSRVEWEFIPEGWAYAKEHPEVKGWNVQGVLETYKKKWPQFVAMVQGTLPLGMAHESALTTNEDICSHNTMMAYAYALALATHKKDRISMLYWGGGIGHYYLLAQALLPDVEIDYHCKDVPVLCEYGAQLFPQQHFYLDDRCFDRDYDFVLASTSMQYTEEWQPLLKRLAFVASGYLYIANLPIVQQASSFVFLQRPYQYGYNTEYLAWCLNRSEFLQTSERTGLDLVREFVYGHQPLIHGAPEQNTYRGYLFRGTSKGKLEPRNR
jgi:putative methyltransferase (TIGR04325 family)